MQLGEIEKRGFALCLPGLLGFGPSKLIRKADNSMVNYHLTGKAVAITGGTSGIGEEVAAAFAKQGANVIVCGRSAEKGKAAQGRFVERGVSVRVVQADVSQTESLRAFADSAAAAFGRIDVWVNNAGINIRKH